MNLSRLSGPLSDSDQHARHELSMLIDDAYHEIRYKFFAHCTNSTHLASRLWTAFQLNGYLPASTPFPWAHRRHVQREELTRLVLAAYRDRRPRDGRRWAAQREQAMVRAYSALPDSLMAKLRHLYRLDFAMFGYDPFLDVLYRTRNVTRQE